MRKRRDGEVVCKCGAYKFPHRMMGGRCDGGGFVGEHFEREQYAACRDCHFYERTDEGLRCQVIDGRDDVRECPALAELIAYEGIKLYGINRPPQKGPLRFRR